MVMIILRYYRNSLMMCCSDVKVKKLLSYYVSGIDK